jgi:hypothetical protein
MVHLLVELSLMDNFAQVNDPSCSRPWALSRLEFGYKSLRVLWRKGARTVKASARAQDPVAAELVEIKLLPEDPGYRDNH